MSTEQHVLFYLSTVPMMSPHEQSITLQRGQLVKHAINRTSLSKRISAIGLFIDNMLDNNNMMQSK